MYSVAYLNRLIKFIQDTILNKFNEFSRIKVGNSAKWLSLVLTYKCE